MIFKKIFFSFYEFENWATDSDIQNQFVICFRIRNKSLNWMFQTFICFKIYTKIIK